MDFTTEGMTLEQRYELLEHVDLIPIGTVCYEAGDFTNWTKEIIVTEEELIKTTTQKIKRFEEMAKIQ